MVYTTVSTSAATSGSSIGRFTERLYETCKLYSTTVAYCTITATVNTGSIAISSTSSFVLSREGDLAYAQVPITAGPAAASASVESCSKIGGGSGVAAVTSASSTLRYPHSSPTSANGGNQKTITSTSTSTAESGLSTGAIAGIGVGAGAGALALIGLIAFGVFSCLRRRRPSNRSQVTAESYPSEHEYYPVEKRGPVPAVYEFEQPSMKHEMPASREVQELGSTYTARPGWDRYELDGNR